MTTTLKIVRPLVCSIALAASFCANAGILASLNDVFMSNATSAQTISTKDRVGVFAGSVTFRTPVQNVNLVSFDPPRLDAGCGGIDLYGGSFSFINSQQLIQIFRSVAANAAGLAFKAAIKTISPSLDQLITEFQTLLQHMNGLAKNSCMMAHQIVDPIASKLSDAVNGDGAVGAANTGLFSDTFASLSGYLQSANSYFEKQGENNPTSGNQTIKALIASGTAAQMGVPGLPNPDGSTDDASNPASLNNSILVSFLGYDITGVPCQKSAQDGTPNTTASASAAIQAQVACVGPSTITLDDMKKGGGTGSTRPGVPLHIYKCLNPAGLGTPNGGFDPQVCTRMQVTDFNYEGIQGWVNSVLFGVSDPTQIPGGITPTSLVGKANSSASWSPTPAQVQFMKTAGVPLVPLFAKTSNKMFRVSMAMRLSDFITTCITAKYGESIYKSAQGMRSANTYKFSDDIVANIDKLRIDYLTEQRRCIDDRSLIDIITQINEATRLKAGNNH